MDFPTYNKIIMNMTCPLMFHAVQKHKVFRCCKSVLHIIQEFPCAYLICDELRGFQEILNRFLLFETSTLKRCNAINILKKHTSSTRKALLWYGYLLFQKFTETLGNSWEKSPVSFFECWKKNIPVHAVICSSCTNMTNWVKWKKCHSRIWITPLCYNLKAASRFQHIWIIPQSNPDARSMCKIQRYSWIF